MSEQLEIRHADLARLVETRLVVMCHGEMDPAGWSTTGMLDILGTDALQLGCPTTHHLAHSHAAFALAGRHFRALPDPPTPAAPWQIPAEPDDHPEEKIPTPLSSSKLRATGDDRRAEQKGDAHDRNHPS